MKLTGISKFHKYHILVDGEKMGEFYSQYYLSAQELRIYAADYAGSKDISPNGVKISITGNDGKLNGEAIMPHFGKVA